MHDAITLMMVMGSRGLTLLKELLLGSVSEHVIRKNALPGDHHPVVPIGKRQAIYRPAGRIEMGTFFAPRVDIKELDGHYEITAQLPGVAKEDIQVQVKDGILTL